MLCRLLDLPLHLLNRNSAIISSDAYKRVDSHELRFRLADESTNSSIKDQTTEEPGANNLQGSSDNALTHAENVDANFSQVDEMVFTGIDQIKIITEN